MYNPTKKKNNQLLTEKIDFKLEDSGFLSQTGDITNKEDAFDFLKFLSANRNKIDPKHFNQGIEDINGIFDADNFFRLNGTSTKLDNDNLLAHALRCFQKPGYSPSKVDEEMILKAANKGIINFQGTLRDGNGNVNPEAVKDVYANLISTYGDKISQELGIDKGLLMDAFFKDGRPEKNFLKYLHTKNFTTYGDDGVEISSTPTSSNNGSSSTSSGSSNNNGDNSANEFLSDYPNVKKALGWFGESPLNLTAGILGSILVGYGLYKAAKAFKKYREGKKREAEIIMSKKD